MVRLLELEPAVGSHVSSEPSSSIVKPDSASMPRDSSNSATPHEVPTTRLWTTACELPDGAGVYTTIRSSKQGRAIQTFRPRLTRLIRFESLTASSSNLIVATRFAGFDFRDEKGASEVSSAEDSSRRSNRRRRRVLCNVDCVDSWYERDDSKLQDRGNRGLPGICNNGGTENGGTRLLAVNEWVYARGATDRGVEDDVGSDLEEDVAEERSSSESSPRLVRTYDLNDERASQPNDEVSSNIGFWPIGDRTYGEFSSSGVGRLGESEEDEEEE